MRCGSLAPFFVGPSGCLGSSSAGAALAQTVAMWIALRQPAADRATGRHPSAFPVAFKVGGIAVCTFVDRRLRREARPWTGHPESQKADPTTSTERNGGRCSGDCTV